LSPEEAEEKKRIKEITLVARKAKNTIASREWREKNKERIREYNLSIANNKQKVYLETYRVKNLGNIEWLEKKRARGRKWALKKRIEVKQQLEKDKKELFFKKTKLDLKDRIDDFLLKNKSEIINNVDGEMTKLQTKRLKKLEKLALVGDSEMEQIFDSEHDEENIIKLCKELEDRINFEYSSLCQELKEKKQLKSEKEQVVDGTVSFD
jgi:hypothetical protein